MDIRSDACKGKQNGRQVRQYGCHSNFVAPRRGCFTKTPHFKSSDCNAEAIHRSSKPIRHCLKKSNRDTHTRTHNYCNPAAHACRGLINITCSYDNIGIGSIWSTDQLLIKVPNICQFWLVIHSQCNLKWFSVLVLCSSLAFVTFMLQVSPNCWERDVF